MGASSDNDPDFTDDFCGFLQRCVASVDAAELLLALLADPQRAWDTRALRSRLEPGATLTEGEVERYLDVLESNGLVTRGEARTVRYRPAPAHDAHATALARLYVERPVTLFRVIYALRDLKINTFADAFKLRR